MTEKEMIGVIYEGFLEMRTDIKELKTDFADLKKDVSSLETSVSSLETSVSSLETNVSSLETSVSSLETSVKSLETRVGNVEHRVGNIELTLENNIRQDIKAIAEGHLDLHRKLDESLKTSSEREMIKIRVNSLENDVRIIKDKMEIEV